MDQNTGAPPAPASTVAPTTPATPVPARDGTPALSFGAVADAYDRARPSYPREAAAWLAGAERAQVLELGAGTGLLTEQLDGLGHRVLATDPLAPMLAHLVRRLPRVPTAQSAAEHIPMRARSVDAVVAAQAFHWFDLPRALPEIARVLRPGGHLALVWNRRDDRIPWVKRLGTLIEPAPAADLAPPPVRATDRSGARPGARPGDRHAEGPADGGTDATSDELDPTHALLSSHLFGYVERATFRFWQHLDRPRLRDLVTSRSHVALMGEVERRRLLTKVDELYADYGRGADGMLMPYVTHCFRAVVRPPSTGRSRSDGGAAGHDGGDADSLLIDFQ